MASAVNVLGRFQWGNSSGNRGLCLLDCREGLEKLGDMRHFEQCLYLRIHCRKGELPAGFLRGHVDSHECAKPRGVDKGNSSEVDDDCGGSFRAERVLKLENCVDIQRALDVKNLVPVMGTRGSDNLDILVWHGWWIVAEWVFTDVNGVLRCHCGRLNEK
jgi:hypothetical protein